MGGAAPRRRPLHPSPAALPPVEGIDIAPILEEVEFKLRRQVSSSSRFVEEAARYLMDAGGKRFRPMLVAVCGHLPSAPERADGRLSDAGVVVELVHLATLYHDDVIDEAPARRGSASANARWRNTVAILTGDYLFARASELSADLGVEVTRIMARTIATLCEGQIREVQGSRGALPPDVPPIEATVDHYLRVISEKTASLIATSCRLGVLLCGGTPEEVEAAARYGWNVGMAFQLSDDILDITSPTTESGKTPGTDLREGVRTIPVLLALEDEPDGELARLLDTNSIEEAAVARCITLLRHSGAVERARAYAARYARAASACLAVFRDGPATAALRTLADHTVVRTG